MSSRSLLKENSGLLELAQRFLDPLVVVASGLVLYAIQFGNLDFPRNYIFILTGSFLLCLAVFPFFKIYRPYRGASLWAETQTLASAWTVVFAGLVIALFVTKTSTYFSRLWIGQWAEKGVSSNIPTFSVTDCRWPDRSDLNLPAHFTTSLREETVGKIYFYAMMTAGNG